MYEIILFAKEGYTGVHHHIYADEIGKGDPNLFRTESSSSQKFSDKFSSAVVLSGKWNFYEKIDFESSFGVTLIPGLYDKITDQGLPETDIMSVKLEGIDEEGEEKAISEIVLFEHINYHGRHHHIFAIGDNFIHGNLSDSSFNNITSSIVIKRGIWALYDGYNADGTPFNILGPGMYSWKDTTPYFIDDISSLKHISDCPEIKLNEIILFNHQQFGGKHHHVFTQDRNLGFSGMDDITYSMIVKSGRWAFYNGGDFASVYSTEGKPIKLNSGMYEDISDFKIDLEAVSSVRQL